MLLGVFLNLFSQLFPLMAICFIAFVVIMSMSIAVDAVHDPNPPIKGMKDSLSKLFKK